MSAEYCQFTDDSKIDDSFIRRDFEKIYHQHAAEVNLVNQKTKYSFGENPIYIKVGNGYLELEIGFKKPMVQTLLMLII